VFWRFAAGGALALGLLLSGCATPQETYPTRTATEQLLVSHAAERAAQEFSLKLPHGAKVFLDTTYFRGEGSDYAASALREALARGGHSLVPTKSEASVIVEIRVGALSTDRVNRVVGIPRLTVPISSAMDTIAIPELSVYSRRDRYGVAEFSSFAYDARTGAPIALGGRMSGVTHIRSHTLFMIFSWGDQQVRPGHPTLDPLPWWKVL
jgi:hypothetical protein